MTRFFPRLAALLSSVSCAALLGACDRASGGTTDETSTVTFYLPDGAPAAGARVQIYASSDTTRKPRDQVFADRQGRVRLPRLEADYYNLVTRDENGRAIFQDSLVSDGKRMDFASDTLVETGVVVGRVRVQPQHSPRIVWIALLGSGTYLNVDDSGRFRIEGVAEGRYTVAGFTKTEGYTTTFGALRVKRDSVSDIGTLEMVFTGLPVVRNLEARFDTLAGVVHLRWDSVGLRETWKYTVLRDGMPVGATTGARWIDTVSDEYPADVPSEGRHVYRVVVSDAERSGPVWESIEMRILSAYLYQEVNVDWAHKAALPWPEGSFEVEVSDGVLHAWRSAEKGSMVQLEGDSIPRRNLHRGLVERWESRDSGATWSKDVDSLRLACLPVHHAGRWWAVREKPGPLERWSLQGDSATYEWRPEDVTKFYDTLVIVTSTDGRRWDSLTTLSGVSGTTSLRFELGSTGLCLVGSKSAWMVDEDVAWWCLEGSTFVRSIAQSVWEAAALGLPARGYSSVTSAYFWLMGMWSIRINPMRFGVVEINQRDIPSEWQPYDADNPPRVVPVSTDRVVLFQSIDAISMDSSLTTFHTISWPGGGFHRELMWGSRILSISDSGVYLGRILSGLEGGDPRGTWVKKTETPRVF